MTSTRSGGSSRGSVIILVRVAAPGDNDLWTRHVWSFVTKIRHKNVRHGLLQCGGFEHKQASQHKVPLVEHALSDYLQAKDSIAGALGSKNGRTWSCKGTTLIAARG